MAFRAGRSRPTLRRLTADIRAWLPKVKKGGWLSGDDYNDAKWPDVVRTIKDVLPGAHAWSTDQWRWTVR